MIARCPSCAVPLTQGEEQGALCPACHQPLRRSSLPVASVNEPVGHPALEISENLPRKIWGARIIWILFGGLIILGLLVWVVSEPRRPAPKPLPEDLVAAWKSDGAEVGWMPGSAFSYFSNLEGVPGQIPAFRFPRAELKDGMLSKLPAPEMPFALCLEQQKLTSVVLQELANFDQLEYLHVEGGMHITDQAGLKELARLPHLRTLNLFDWSVTDKGLEALADLRQLERLSIIRAEVTDGGLSQLVGLKKLQRLTLYSTHVTPAGVRQLQKVLPKCEITCENNPRLNE